MRKRQAWISEDFHKFLKKKAIEEDMSILNLSQKLAQEQTMFDINPPSNKKKRLRL